MYIKDNVFYSVNDYRYSKYKIDNKGNVLLGNRILKRRIDKNGEVYVRLRDLSGNKRRVLVRDLLAITFFNRNLELDNITTFSVDGNSFNTSAFNVGCFNSSDYFIY